MNAQHFVSIIFRPYRQKSLHEMFLKTSVYKSSMRMNTTKQTLMVTAMECWLVSCEWMLLDIVHLKWPDCHFTIWIWGCSSTVVRSLGFLKQFCRAGKNQTVTRNWNDQGLKSFDLQVSILRPHNHLMPSQRSLKKNMQNSFYVVCITVF